jgi:monoamine oxidase
MYPAKLAALKVEKTVSQMPMEGFTAALGNFFGSELGGNPSRWSKIKGGNDNLPKAFAQRLSTRIHFGSPAVRIEQDEKSVRVVFLKNGSPQTISADRLLCAAPFSLLRNVEMPANFPERRRDIIKNLHYDSVSRVYLQTKRRSWEDKGLNGFAITSDAVEIWQPSWSQPGPRGIIMTYNRPGQAELIAAMKDNDRISSTLTQLDPLFPGLRDNFERGATKVWVEDEWSRGAWAFIGVRDFIAASSAEGRIHFAGEHLSPWFSWMQGALDSSARAVKQINEAV